MALDHITLPDWNSLSNDERTELVKIVSWFSWPPGNDGQFALEFYNAVKKMAYEHRPKILMVGDVQYRGNKPLPSGCGRAGLLVG
jgi:hypothetical protein